MTFRSFFVSFMKSERVFAAQTWGDKPFYSSPRYRFITNQVVSPLYGIFSKLESVHRPG